MLSVSNWVLKIVALCQWGENIYVFVSTSWLHQGFAVVLSAALCCGMWPPHGSGFSCCRARGFSSCGLQALECELSI